MKSKTKITSIVLILTVILSAFALSSCGEDGIPVSDIGGKTPSEAYSAALTSLENNRNYEIEIDMEFDVKLIGLSVYGVDIDDFCIYKYSGDNEHYILSPNAEPTLAKYGMEGIVSKSDDAVWYVDGICYVDNNGEKRQFKAETSPLKRSKYESAITEVVEENTDAIQCYNDEGEHYFVVEITDPNAMKLGMGADKETYRVYLDSNGQLDEIIVECKVKTLGLITLDVDYSYGDVTISIPANPDSFIKK